jgi:hypothetical protein
LADISESLGLAQVEVGGLLEAVRRIQEARFAKVIANELQAYRHATLAEASGQAHARQAGE